MTHPDEHPHDGENESATGPAGGQPDESGSADRPTLTTDDEAQTDDSVIDPGNS